MNARQKIRQQIRQARQALSAKAQAVAADHVLQQFKRYQEQNNPLKKIGLYLANDGELSTQTIINYCWRSNIDVYVPVIHPFSKGYLLFLRYAQSTALVKNKYDINEPLLTVSAICPINELDCVFTPLVAFDKTGQRLGMGGGYYDRTFAFTQQATNVKPALVGLAHDCQQVDSLPSEAWDVPLPKIITPSAIYQFK